MKTRKILAASTAALLSFASVAAVASAAAVDIEYDEDGIDIGGGVLAFINDNDESKFEDYTLEASTDTFTGTSDSNGNTVVDTDNDPVVKDLSKSLKKELGKVKVSEIAVYKIDLAKGIYSEDTAPAAIKITIPSVSFDAKVYHVNGDSVKLVKSTTRALAAGGYEVSFTTRDFSSFILTTAELKNAGTSNNTSDPDSSNSDSSGAAAGNNANTGIALAIAPVLLAATAVSVVALKKKK